MVVDCTRLFVVIVVAVVVIVVVVVLYMYLALDTANVVVVAACPAAVTFRLQLTQEIHSLSYT